ncbi:unnamed protein product [Spirodela intermedia]|uniref:Uncharacterized protein n=1 Tax=Spirodela intermedia TaxID=51605 RepID=A0A7I8J4T3_SPIIN|nr:unnamed protein product [Spirodela intermedia]CAA6665258.1 unnamed protein product [Spirodela intermedia]
MAATAPSSLLLSPLILLLLLMLLLFPAASIRPAKCPTYEVVDQGKGYEIRRYNSTAWTSTAAIEDISLVEATRTAFLQLFDYIQGKNEYGEKIEMTAPVITEVAPSDGPICASSFVVSFYVPKKNQANPPPAAGLLRGLRLRRGRREEAATLYESLAGSEWAAAADPAAAYIVAQYNSPFEFTGRVNEIWIFLVEGIKFTIQ